MSRLLRAAKEGRPLSPYPIKRCFIQLRHYTEQPRQKPSVRVTLNVSDLPPSLQPKEVEELFEKYGIKSANTYGLNPTESGTAVIELFDEKEADRAVEELHRSILRGYRIFVEKQTFPNEDKIHHGLAFSDGAYQESEERLDRTLKKYFAIKELMKSDEEKAEEEQKKAEKEEPPPSPLRQEDFVPSFDDFAKPDIPMPLKPPTKYPYGPDPTKIPFDQEEQPFWDGFPPPVQSFNRDHLKGWLENIKTKYEIDLFNQFYDTMDKELLTDAGLQDDQQAKEELITLHKEGQTFAHDDQDDPPYIGEMDGWEQFVHDSTCSNPSNPEIISKIWELSQSDFPKLVGRDDFELASAHILGGDQGIELKASCQIFPDFYYWLQYSYFLSVYLTRLLGISSQRLLVNIVDHDDEKSETENFLDDSDEDSGISIFITLLDQPKDSSANSEYDSELGPLSAVSVESEDYHRVKSRYNRKPVLKKINGQLHLDLTNLYSTTSALSFVKQIADQNDLIAKYSWKPSGPDKE